MVNIVAFTVPDHLHHLHHFHHVHHEAEPPQHSFHLTRFSPSSLNSLSTSEHLVDCSNIGDSHITEHYSDYFNYLVYDFSTNKKQLVREVKQFVSPGEEEDGCEL